MAEWLPSQLRVAFRASTATLIPHFEALCQADRHNPTRVSSKAHFTDKTECFDVSA